MNKPVLVVMAAGMGSRYGGMKQIDPVGPNGQVIVDYSLYDARRAGFETVIFVIKHEIEETFKAAIGDRVAKVMKVKYAFQQLVELPAGFGHGAHGKNVSANMSIMDETTEQVQSSVPLTLEAGSVTDVGVGVMTMAALQGLVWLDENDDGVYQDGEPGQAGIKIRAVGVKNGLVYETESGEDGKFYIGQMRYGTYNVEYSLPDGLVFARYSQTGGKR